MIESPQELQHLDQWVCWRSECRSQSCGTIIPPGEGGCPECGEKATKRPINPKTGNYARPDDSSTWKSLETAKRFYVDDGSTHGIGFFFSESDDIVGIDLDDCRDPESGDIDDWALGIVKQINSFTEVSPSGTGLHIYAYGEVPEGGNRRDGVEMYDKERYFTVTGDRIPQSPASINYRADEIAAVHEGHVYSESAAHAEGVDFEIKGEFEERSSYTNDLGESLEEIRDRDDKLDRLFKTIEGDYESASEADMAAASKLWFWRFDPQDIANIIRQYRTRPKVIERDDYLERTIAKVTAGERYDPRANLDDPVEILGDRERYSSIDEADLPDDVHFVLDKPPREGGSHASIKHLLREDKELVILVSRHSIGKHHLEILGEMLPDTECAVHLVGKRLACDHPDKDECPNKPEGRDEIFDLKDEVIDICYRKQAVSVEDCPDRFCGYSFIKQAEELAHTVVTVPQLLGSMERDFEENNLLIDEEQALGHFRPGSSELIEVVEKYEPDGTRTVQLLSSNISTQYRALKSIRKAVYEDQEQRRSEAEEEDRGWRRNPWEIDIVNAIDYAEEIKRELGITETTERLIQGGDDVTAKNTIDDILERLESIDRPEPRSSPDKFRKHLSDYTARWFHDDNVDPGGFIESVLFPYDDRPFDFKKTGAGHTLRMIGGREVFHADDLRSFNQIGVIAGPEGEMLFEDIGADAKTILIDDFRYAEDFVVVPIGREYDGEMENPKKQRERARKVSKLLNDDVHPHIAVTGTKERAEDHHSELDRGLSNVVSNPQSPAKDMRTLWSAGETAIIYENSAVSRGIDAPFFDISVVISTGFATPYWEARAKHYRGEDEDEHLRAQAIESQLKARELTNAVLRPSPTYGTEEYCGTKFIVASDWDAYRLKYLQDRTMSSFAYAENAANFLKQATIGGGLRLTIDDIFDEVNESEREFIEITMETELTETVHNRPSYTLEEVSKWRENRYLISGNELKRAKNAIPLGGDAVPTKHIRDLLSDWSGGRISASLSVMERKGIVKSFKSDEKGENGKPIWLWENNEYG